MATPLNAVSAYANTVRAGMPGGGSPLALDEIAPQDKGPSFSALVEQAADNAIEIGRKAEQVSAKAVVGKADLNDVVAAVANAEVTLQTVVAVRDRVVSAYQEIMRMPM